MSVCLYVNWRAIWAHAVTPLLKNLMGRWEELIMRDVGQDLRYIVYKYRTDWRV